MTRLINSLIVISIVVIISFAVGTNNIGFYYLYLLPISVLLLTLGFKRKLSQYKSSLVSTLLLIQVGIRYLALPLLSILSKSIFIGQAKMYHIEVVFFMILELIIVYSVLAYNSKKQSDAFVARQNISKYFMPSVGLLLVLSVVFAYIIYTNYFLRVNYIWQLENYMAESNEIEKSSTLAAILFNPLRIISSLMLISYIYKKKIKVSHKAFFLFMILILNSIIIVGSSRFSIVFATVPLAFIIYLLFYDLRKYILIGMVVTLSIVIAVSTLNKFSNPNQNSESYNMISESSLNAYFSGQENINTGLHVYYERENWERVKFLMNDFFQNIPIASKLTNDEFKTNIYFNEKIYGHRYFQDQIVPLTLNGLIHFGVIGPMLYPLIFITLALYFERKYFQCKFIGDKFIYIYLALVFSLIFMLNIGFIIASLFTTLFFIALPVKTINYFTNFRNNK